ncbi:MAG: hypothetical protein ABII06_10620 [Pseudomonadota bacterium]
MKLEYGSSKHPADAFQHLVYFCSDRGECRIKDIKPGQNGALAERFNDRGRDGWELVQAHFRQEGIVALWKRALI